MTILATHRAYCDHPDCRERGPAKVTRGRAWLAALAVGWVGGIDRNNYMPAHYCPAHVADREG